MPVKLQDGRFGLGDGIHFAERHDVTLYQVSFEQNTRNQIYNAKLRLTTAYIEFYRLFLRCRQN